MTLICMHLQFVGTKKNSEEEEERKVIVSSLIKLKLFAETTHMSI